MISLFNLEVFFSPENLTASNELLVPVNKYMILFNINYFI